MLWISKAFYSFLASGCLLWAQSDEIIGSLQKSQGPVLLTRAGQKHPVTRPEHLCLGDVIQTGEGGSAGLLLRDDTAISIGPNSKLVLERFSFAPEQGRLGLLTRLFKGTMALLSGKIARLSPDAVKVETPVATVGIRGTYLLVQVFEKPS